jgi:hypothetical protein
MAVQAPKYLFDETSKVCTQFRRDGYLVIENGIDSALIDQVRSDIEERLSSASENERPPLAGFNYETGRYQDAWRLLPSVAHVAGAPRVIEVLEHLYGLEARPFQTLNFVVGTQQRAHSDHIHFSSRPLGFMCGVWIALEDVNEENGPLFYYPGSHNLPYLNYSDLGIDQSRHEFEAGSYDEYEAAIEKYVEAHGFAREIFTAKKGDVLIWAANLVHGGSPVVKEGSSRWSQVTHYLFDDCVHYTPRLSNEDIGQLFVRKPIDVRNSLPIRSAYVEPTLGDTSVQISASSESIQGPSDEVLKIQRLQRRVKRLESELDAMRNTRLFRYTRLPRKIYASLRGTNGRDS